MPYTPYLQYYVDILRSENVPYDVVLWDRMGCIEQAESNHTVFRRKLSGSLQAGISDYAAYRSFILRHLSSHGYDLYIVLTAQIGVILWDHLIRQRFILDIRDYSKESMWAYRALEQLLIKRSMLTCISSDGFREWLPHGKNYVLSHNTTTSKLRLTATPFDFETRIISYIGMIGYYKPTIRFLNGAHLIPGVELRYAGHGDCETQLAQFCREHHIGNVSFSGFFSPEEKSSFYQATNFVTSIYGRDTPIVRTAIPNKLYESCIHKRPVIVNYGTYLADVVRDNGIGIVVDLDDLSNLPEMLDWYYQPSNYQQYVANCEEYLAKITRDISVFEEAVRLALGKAEGL